MGSKREKELKQVTMDGIKKREGITAGFNGWDQKERRNDSKDIATGVRVMEMFGNGRSKLGSQC